LERENRGKEKRERGRICRQQREKRRRWKRGRERERGVRGRERESEWVFNEREMGCI
jgi:hypothetical protein